MKFERMTSMPVDDYANFSTLDQYLTFINFLHKHYFFCIRTLKNKVVFPPRR